MNYILNIEQQLFLFLNNLGQPKYDLFWLFMSNEYAWIPTYILLLIIIYYKFGLKNTIILCLVLFLFIYISDSLSMICKTYTERLRPCRNHLLDGKFRLVIEKCRGTYSFFSAHASSHTTLSIILFYVFKNYKTKYLLLIWAMIISYSRIYLGVHFPLDIIIGVIVGIFLGYLGVLILKKINFIQENNKRVYFY